MKTVINSNTINFIELCEKFLSYAEFFTFCVYDAKSTSDNLERFMQSVSPYIISKTRGRDWFYGVVSNDGSNLTCYQVKYNSDVFNIIKKNSQKLSDWRMPNLPENIGLHRRDRYYLLAKDSCADIYRLYVPSRISNNFDNYKISKSDENELLCHGLQAYMFKDFKNNNQFRNFLTTAQKKCDRATLVFESESKLLKSETNLVNNIKSIKDTTITLSEYWPSRDFVTANSDEKYNIINFRLCDEVIELILERYNSFSEMFNENGYLEDLCFYRKDGTPYFISLTTDEIYFLYVDNSEKHDLNCVELLESSWD